MPNDNSRDDMALALREMSEAQGDKGGQVVVQEAREITPADVARDVAPSPPADKREDRDTSGRFTSREPVSKEPVPADKKPGTEVTPAPKPGALSAPVSWKPEEREGWAEIKPIHQAAIVRRDREVDNALRVSAEARSVYSELQRIVAPYEQMIRSENSNPLRSIEYLFKTAHDLRTLSPGPKAAMIADLIRQFKVDIPMLDSILRQSFASGGAPVAVPQSPMDILMAQIRQELAPVKEFMNGVGSMTQQSEQKIQTEVAQTWDDFARDPENEFANDLADDIADILTLAAKHGAQVSLQDAYKRATLAHPTISEIIRSRTEAAGGAQQTAAARRALEAAASISNSGGAPARGGEEAGDGSTRSDVQSAIRELTARR